MCFGFIFIETVSGKFERINIQITILTTLASITLRSGVGKDLFWLGVKRHYTLRENSQSKVERGTEPKYKTFFKMMNLCRTPNQKQNCGAGFNFSAKI